MHHLHYLTLWRLLGELGPELQGGRFIQAFSQQRDELVLLLKGRGRALFLRMGCGGGFTYLAPERRFCRARRNSIDLFSPLEEGRLERLGLQRLDRCLVLDLGGDTRLYLKLHSHQANAILLQPQAEPLLFRRQLVADRQFRLADSEVDWFEPQAWPLVPPPLADWRPPPQQLWTFRALRSQWPFWDRALHGLWIAYRRAGYPPLDAWNATWRQTASQPPYLHLQGGRLDFRLTPPRQPQGQLRLARNVCQGLERYLHQELSLQFFKKHYNHIQQTLAAQQKQARRRLKQAEQQLAAAQRTPDPETCGHLILAYLHQIPPGAERVSLPDFATGQPVELSLNPELTPQQNAARYYERHRKLQQQLPFAQKIQQAAQQELAQLQETSQALGKIRSGQGLRRFLKQHPTLVPQQDNPPGKHTPGAKPQGKTGKTGKAVKTGKVGKTTPTEGRLPYRSFFYQGYEIRVGRSARDNDALSLRYTRKHDLWLHAREAAGSHVVVRLPASINPPEAVLEVAASLAAYYSKARNQDWTPVSYTRAKYVRKGRRMGPGQVRLDREEVLLAPPQSPEELGLV